MKKTFTAFRYDSGQISTSGEQPDKARPSQHLPSENSFLDQGRQQDFASRHFPYAEAKKQDFASKHCLNDEVKNQHFGSRHLPYDEAKKQDFASKHCLNDEVKNQDFASWHFPYDEAKKQDFASKHCLNDEVKNQDFASWHLPYDEAKRQYIASQQFPQDETIKQVYDSQCFLQDKDRNPYFTFQDSSQDGTGKQYLPSQHFLHHKARNQVFTSENFVQDTARHKHSASQYFLQDDNARNQDYTFRNFVEGTTVGNQLDSASRNYVFVGGLYGNVNVKYHKTDMETASAFNQGSSSSVNSISSSSIKQEEKEPYPILCLTQDAKIKLAPRFACDSEIRYNTDFSHDAKINSEPCLSSQSITMPTDDRMRQTGIEIKAETCTESNEIKSNDVDSSKSSNMSKPDNVVSEFQVTSADANEEKVMKVAANFSGMHRNLLIKPPYTYSAMCIMAIEMSETKALTISDIKEKVHNMFPDIKHEWLCWRERVGHCVASSRYFSEVFTMAGNPSKQVRLWKVNHSTLKPKMFERTRHDSSTAKQYKEYLHDQLGVPPLCKLKTLTSMRKLAPKRRSQEHMKKSSSQRNYKTILPVLLPRQTCSNEASTKSGNKNPKPLSQKSSCKTTMLPSHKCSEKTTILPSQDTRQQSVVVKSEVYDSRNFLHTLAITDKRGDEMTSPPSSNHSQVCSTESLLDKDNQDLILDLSAESEHKEPRFPVKIASSTSKDHDFTNLVDCKKDGYQRHQKPLNQPSLCKLSDGRVPSCQLQDDRLLHHQQPNYQQPNYQAPNYQVPNYQAPNYQVPNYQQPNYQAPNYQVPNYQVPNYQAPNYQVPKNEAPNYLSAHYQLPNHQMSNNVAGLYPHMSSLPYTLYRQSTSVPAVSSQGQVDNNFTSQLLQNPGFLYLRDYTAGLQMAMSIWYYEQCRARAVAEQDENQNCNYRPSHSPTTQLVKTSQSQKVKPDQE